MANLRKWGALSVIGLMTLSACSQDDFFKEDESGAQAVSFISSISRVADNSWNEGDQVGIFMKKADNALAGFLEENKRYNASVAGNLVHDGAEQALYFPATGEKVDFVAYYPYTATVTEQKVSVNVSDQSVQSNIDLLYAATSTGFNNLSKAVPLNFTHKLSRILLEVSSTSDAELKDVTLEGTETMGALSLNMGSFETISGNVAPITYKLTAPSAKNWRAEAIVLPAGALDANATLNFTIGSQTYRHSVAGMELKEATSYTFKVSINENDGKPTVVVGNATITDWTVVTGGDIDIDLDGGATDPSPEPNPGDYEVIFLETFGAPVKVGNNWVSVDKYTDYDNYGVLTFTDRLQTAGYSYADVRSTSTLPAHLWLPTSTATVPDKSAAFKISGFSTAGYSNLKLTYDLAVNQAKDQNVIRVFADETELSVPSKQLTPADKFQTIELVLPKGTTAIEFLSETDYNTVGFRITNISLSGVK